MSIEGVAIAGILGVTKEQMRKNLHRKSRIGIHINTVIHGIQRKRFRLQSQPQSNTETQTEPATKFWRMPIWRIK